MSEARSWSHYVSALDGHKVARTPQSYGKTVEAYSDWVRGAHPADADRLITILVAHLDRHYPTGRKP